MKSFIIWTQNPKDSIGEFKKNLIDTKNVKSIRVYCSVKKSEESKINEVLEIISNIVGKDIKIELETNFDYPADSKMMISIEDIDTVNRLEKTMNRALEIIKDFKFYEKAEYEELKNIALLHKENDYEYFNRLIDLCEWLIMHEFAEMPEEEQLAYIDKITNAIYPYNSLQTKNKNSVQF